MGFDPDQTGQAQQPGGVEEYTDNVRASIGLFVHALEGVVGRDSPLVRDGEVSECRDVVGFAQLACHVRQLSAQHRVNLVELVTHLPNVGLGENRADCGSGHGR